MCGWEQDAREPVFRMTAEAQSCPEWQKPLEVAMRHLSFAPQRWDSQSTPLRRFAAALVPVALFLAIQSQDKRHQAGFREKCAQTLVKLEPMFLVDIGLCADYSNEWTRFLRIFDREDHDPALAAREKQEMTARTGSSRKPMPLFSNVIRMRSQEQ